MAVLVLTAAWRETLTVPGMAYPVPGITQRAHTQKGETESPDVFPWFRKMQTLFFSSVLIPQK